MRAHTPSGTVGCRCRGPSRILPRTSRKNIRTYATAGEAATAAVDVKPIINGCWQFAGGHGREVFDRLEDKLLSHAKAGFTSFDTADIYGPSERILGEFQVKWREAGGQPLQLLTKYVPDTSRGAPAPADVEAAIRKSLANLQVDCLDMVQMHWWDYGVPGMTDTALALADLQSRGLIREVALTNMNTEAVAAIVDAGVRVAANQVKFSLLDRRPVTGGLLQYCEQQGIKIFAYGPLGGGLLSDRHVQQPTTNFLGQKRWSNVDLNTWSLKMYWTLVKYNGGQDRWRELLLVLRGVADKHNATVANVALRWLMQQGSGSTVHPIVGLRTAKHIEDNQRALALRLDAEDLATIAGALEGMPGPGGDAYSFERGLPA